MIAARKGGTSPRTPGDCRATCSKTRPSRRPGPAGSGAGAGKGWRSGRLAPEARTSDGVGSGSGRNGRRYGGQTVSKKKGAAGQKVGKLGFSMMSRVVIVPTVMDPSICISNVTGPTRSPSEVTRVAVRRQV